MSVLVMVRDLLALSRSLPIFIMRLDMLQSCHTVLAPCALQLSGMGRLGSAVRHMHNATRALKALINSVPA